MQPDSPSSGSRPTKPSLELTVNSHLGPLPGEDGSSGLRSSHRTRFSIGSRQSLASRPSIKSSEMLGTGSLRDRMEAQARRMWSEARPEDDEGVPSQQGPQQPAPEHSSLQGSAVGSKAGRSTERQAEGSKHSDQPSASRASFQEFRGACMLRLCTKQPPSGLHLKCCPAADEVLRPLRGSRPSQVLWIGQDGAVRQFSPRLQVGQTSAFGQAVSGTGDLHAICTDPDVPCRTSAGARAQGRTGRHWLPGDLSQPEPCAYVSPSLLQPVCGKQHPRPGCRRCGGTA